MLALIVPPDTANEPPSTKTPPPELRLPSPLSSVEFCVMEAPSFISKEPLLLHTPPP